MAPQRSIVRSRCRLDCLLRRATRGLTKPVFDRSATRRTGLTGGTIDQLQYVSRDRHTDLVLGAHPTKKRTNCPTRRRQLARPTAQHQDTASRRARSRLLAPRRGRLRSSSSRWIRLSALGGFLRTILHSRPTTPDAFDAALFHRTPRSRPQPHVLRRIQCRQRFGDGQLGARTFLCAKLELS